MTTAMLKTTTDLQRTLDEIRARNAAARHAAIAALKTYRSATLGRVTIPDND